MSKELDEDVITKPMTERSKRKLKRQRRRHEPAEQIARQVRVARRCNRMTQAGLAKAIGSDQTVIARVENARTNPSLKLLKKLANALDAALEIMIKPEKKPIPTDWSDIDDLNN